MSEAAEFRGAHAPRVLRSAPSPIVLPNDRNFGEGAEKCTRGGVCSPSSHEFQT
jgi:hypothetical protein